MVKVGLVRTNFYTRWACHVCGGRTEKVPVLAEVMSGEHKGFRVCERWLEAGDIPARMRDHADQLHQEAFELKVLADKVNVPSYAEWKAEMQQAEDEWRRVLEEGHRMNEVYERRRKMRAVPTDGEAFALVPDDDFDDDFDDDIPF